MNVVQRLLFQTVSIYKLRFPEGPYPSQKLFHPNIHPKQDIGHKTGVTEAEK